MKRVKGFTLAEVLITLGIIGVVAALTAPALIQNAGNAKIGPTLQKVKSTIENANERILFENDVSSLAAVASNEIEYLELLSEYISGSSYNETTLTADDFDPELKFYTGLESNDYIGYYRFDYSNSVTLMMSDLSEGYSSAKGSFKGGYLIMAVDINGLTTSPNTIGKDIFDFVIDKGGTVVPWGSSTHKWYSENEDVYWGDSGSAMNQCNEDTVGTGQGCAGSIFDNNLKVIYQ